MKYRGEIERGIHWWTRISEVAVEGARNLRLDPDWVAPSTGKRVPVGYRYISRKQGVSNTLETAVVWANKLIYSRLMPFMKLLSNLWFWPTKKGFQPHLLECKFHGSYTSLWKLHMLDTELKLPCVTDFSFSLRNHNMAVQSFHYFPSLNFKSWESIPGNTDTRFAVFFSS